MNGRGWTLALSLVALVLGLSMPARSATLSSSCDDQRHDVIFFTLAGTITDGDATALAAKIDECVAKYDLTKVREAADAAYKAHNRKVALQLDQRTAALEARAYVYGAPPMTLYLDSPGGDLREALTIGRLVRRHRLATIVDLNGRECSGACVFVFLGGVARKYSWDSVVFLTNPERLPGQAVGNAGETNTAGDVAGFLTEMGVTPRLGTMMHAVPVGGRSRLDKEVAVQLNVIGVDETYGRDVRTRYLEFWGTDAQEIMDAAAAQQRVARQCALQARRAAVVADAGDIPVPRLDYHAYLGCLTADGPALQTWRRYLQAIRTIDAVQASMGRRGLPVHRLFAEAAGDWGF